jgi:hypothetical protein
MKRLQRDRKLTPEEVAADRAAREQIAKELPKIVTQQRQDSAMGHQSVEDVLAMRRLVSLLCEERRRQGIRLSEISQRTGLELAVLEDLEDHRASAPGVAVLTRYARALGKKLDFVLVQGDRWQPLGGAEHVAAEQA